MTRLPKGIREWQLLAGAVLAAVVVAVLVLGRPGAPEPAPAVSTATTELPGGDAVVPVVAPTTGRRGRGGLVGKRIDPFKPARTPKRARATSGRGAVEGSSAGTPAVGATSSSAAPSPITPGGGSTGGGSSSGGGNGSGGAPSSPTPAPTPAATATPAPTTDPGARLARLWRPVLRYGDTSGALRTATPQRLAPLPSAEAPVAVFAGLRPDRQTAVFVVAEGTSVTGGECSPSRAACERLALRTGDVAFVTLDGAELRLELRRVGVSRVTATTERASRERVAEGGREALRALLPRVGDLRYDPRTGVVHGGLR